MRFIEIDGIRVNVERCIQCPCYDDGDAGWGCQCKHPVFEGEPCNGYDAFRTVMPFCPLREVIE